MSEQAEVTAPAGAVRMRAADGIAGFLEEEIVSGALADGAFLPAERDLMSRFKVSRTVAREAVAALARRGLIEARPRFRPVVRRPGIDSALSAVGGVVAHLLKERTGVKTLYDTRIFLEAALVRHAALHARKDDIVRLRAALAANERAIPESEAFYASDVAFHAVFYAVPGNPVFPAVHQAFTAWLAEHWRRMPRAPERNRINYLSHRDIAVAVIDRDPDGAEKALLSHLNAAWEYVRGTFESG